MRHLSSSLCAGLIYALVMPVSAAQAAGLRHQDSPTPRPLVHAIAAVDPHRHKLPEGALSSDTAELKLGRNSFFGAGYTPPDPPPGHGPHRYVFELFALDHTPRLGHRPGRNMIKSEMRGHVIGRGALTAVYERHA